MRKTRKKMSRGKRLLFMGVGVLLVVAALAAVILVQKAIAEKEAAENESSGVVLLNVWKYKEEEIAQVNIYREDETLSLVSRTEDDETEWYLKDYPDADIKSIHSNTIATAMIPQAYELVMEDAKEEDLEQYGLDEPYAVMEVILQDGTIKTLNIGNKSVSATRCYIMEKDSGNVYSTNDSVLNYISYTTLELYDTSITSIYTSYTLKYLYTQAKGETPVEIEYHDFTNDPYNYYQVTAPYRFLQPYNYKNIGVVNSVQETFINVLEDIEYNEIVVLEAKDDELEEYGLGDEPEHRVNVIMYKTESDDSVSEYETDYYFGKTFGDNDEYVYFREADSKTVYGVEVKYRDQFCFDSLKYRQGLLFLSKVDYIETLEMELFGDTYTMSFKELESEESGSYQFEATLNGEVVGDRDIATDILGRCFMIMPDKIFTDSIPEYDENETITIRYEFKDGTKKELVFYQYDDYYYSIQMDDNVWANCEITQLKDLQTIIENGIEENAAEEE